MGLLGGLWGVEVCGCEGSRRLGASERIGDGQLELLIDIFNCLSFFISYCTSCTPPQKVEPFLHKLLKKQSTLHTHNRHRTILISAAPPRCSRRRRRTVRSQR